MDIWSFIKGSLIPYKWRVTRDDLHNSLENIENISWKKVLLVVLSLYIVISFLGAINASSQYPEFSIAGHLLEVSYVLLISAIVLAGGFYVLKLIFKSTFEFGDFFKIFVYLNIGFFILSFLLRFISGFLFIAVFMLTMVFNVATNQSPTIFGNLESIQSLLDNILQAAKSQDTFGIIAAWFKIIIGLPIPLIIAAIVILAAALYLAYKYYWALIRILAIGFHTSNKRMFFLGLIWFIISVVVFLFAVVPIQGKLSNMKEIETRLILEAEEQMKQAEEQRKELGFSSDFQTNPISNTLDNQLVYQKSKDFNTEIFINH